MDHESGGASTSDKTLVIGKKKFPKREVVFFCQVIIIYIVIILSLVNLTLNKSNSDSKLWIALLSSCLGYLLPNPSIKQQQTDKH